MEIGETEFQTTEKEDAFVHPHLCGYLIFAPICDISTHT